MDAIDLKLLDTLQRDGRATQQEMAKAVGLSQPAVAERIRKLEERGVITGYTARLDASQVGKDVTAFIGVGIENPKHLERFTRQVRALPEVLECHRVAGEDSYLLKVKTENTRALDRLLIESIRSLPGVTRTHTTIVLVSLKEETSLHLSQDHLPGGQP